MSTYGRGLDRVDVEQDPLRPRTRSAIVGDRLDRPDLVVGEHHRHQDRPVGERRLELVRVDAAVAVDRQLHDLEAELLEVAERVPDGVVLDRRRDDPVAVRLARPGRALEREVVRLGAAGREHDLAGLGAEPRREPLVGLIEAGRATRPKACAELGLPNVSVRYGSIASRTSRRSGVVAA